MASKNLTEQTKNSLEFIRNSINNTLPNIISTVDNTFVNNVVINSTPITIPSSDIFETNYKNILNKVIDKRGLRLLIEAQSKIEGFKPFSRAFRNNNPGNLTFSETLRIKYQAKLESSGERFAYFNTLEDGISAKKDYIERIVRGEHNQYPKNPTLSKYIYIYAPPKENNTEAYIKFIIDYFKDNNILIGRETLLSTIISFS
jgi:hypothetical protein